MSLIYLPFSYIMKFCVWIAQNSYLFGLFFFALVFQIILFPFAIKQQKSQISRAKIQPKEMAIRERYAGRTDRVTQQKMQQEIQEMYQREGYSPFSGCLPLLIHLPLIFILFAIVRYPIQYSSSFTTEAETEIRAVVEASDEDYQKEDEFSVVFAQFAFDYAEDIRAHLTDNDAAKKANEDLTDRLRQLGSFLEEASDEKIKIDQEKYDNGFDKHTLYQPSVYREMGAVDIIGNYGDAYIEQLKADGALPGDYTPVHRLYVEVNGEKLYYEDMVPNFSFLGINLLRNPSFSNDTWQGWILLLIPLLVFLTSFLSTKITRIFQPAQVGPDGKEIGTGLFMTVGMPLISTVFSLQFPAAIGAYWVWRTLLSMVQPAILHKLYPIPKFSEEEMEEMKRELQKKKKKKIITIEVDEDDDSYRDMEVRTPGGASSVESARPKDEGKKHVRQEELPYRKPTHIEMLSADDDESDAPTGEE